eukprot:COSAG01_NODE_38004_length_495_cov_14.595960_1_plen_48_part_01
MGAGGAAVHQQPTRQERRPLSPLRLRLLLSCRLRDGQLVGSLCGLRLL